MSDPLGLLVIASSTVHVPVWSKVTLMVDAVPFCVLVSGFVIVQARVARTAPLRYVLLSVKVIVWL